MKKILTFTFAALLMQSSFCLHMSPTKAFAQTQETLKNNTIVEMVNADLSDEVIISLIRSSKNSFDTSSTGIMELKRAGVSDAVILEIVKAAAAKEEKTTDGETTNDPSVPSNAPTAMVLLDGTPVKLRIGRTISSADATTGETVDFEVLEDIKIGDNLIIQRGGLAIATITRAKPKARLGKGGKLDLNIDYVRLVSGEKAALRAVKETKGGNYTGTMTGAIVASSILFFPAAPFFLFMKGKDISIPKGTEITAYINGDVSLDPGKFSASSATPETDQ